MAKGKLYLRPSSDILLGHPLYPAESTAGYLLINEEVPDGTATYIGVLSGDEDGATYTSTFGLSYFGDTSVFGSINNFTSGEVVIHGSIISPSHLDASNSTISASLNINGVEVSSIIGSSEIPKFELSVDVMSSITQYIKENNGFPPMTLTITTRAGKYTTKAPYYYGTAYVSTIWVEFGYQTFYNTRKKMGKEWDDVVAGYQKIDGAWQEIFAEDEFHTLLKNSITCYDKPAGVTNLPILNRAQEWRGGRDLSAITQIDFVNSYTPTGNEVDSWSADLDGSGGIMCYINDTILTIAGDGSGGICWHPDSSGAFSGMTALVSITGVDSNVYLYDDTNIANICDGCTMLSSITFPEGVTSIGDSEFNGCSSLTSITIPDSVTSIGDSAFNGCSSLTSITIPDSVTSIGDSAFNGCSSLTSIDVDKNNLNYSSEEGVLFNKTKTTLVSYPSARNNELPYKIPNSVTHIGNRAFYKVGILTSVTIPNSVTSIGNEAFYCGTSSVGYYPIYFEASNSEGITLGKDWNMADGLFGSTTAGCPIYYGVTEDTFVIIDGVHYLKVGDYATVTRGNIGMTEYTILKKVMINEIEYLVTSCGQYVFGDDMSGKPIYYTGDIESWCNMEFDNAYCSPLYNGADLYIGGNKVTNLIIPDTVTSIGYEAFYNCDSLTSVTIGNSVTSIGYEAFYNCDSLTSVTIGNSVTSIGGYAFYNCDSLTSVTIPDSVTSIGIFAFYNCDSLTSVRMSSATPPTLGINVFSKSATGFQIIVPVGSGEAYKTAEIWTTYADYIVEG